ncbi:MAG: FAD binding domain-containing protein [Lachnospiraceae bacterium]|nr:FAD binding domain-containing protein [Lachnospiraceae bacterium]
MMTIQNYIRPQSLEEAYMLNQKKSNRIIGGMLWLKMTNGLVSTAIDLCDLGLDTLEETDDSFSIGAMVSLRQLELHEGLNAYTQGAVAKALQDIVGVQFRNMATIGGSIFGRFGFSDVLTVFLAMDTYVELYKGGIVPLREFASINRDRDVLVRIIVKKHPGTFTYLSMRNTRTDFPVLTCATSCFDGAYHTVIGARPERAVLLEDIQGILSGGINQQTASSFADFAAENIKVGSNVRGSAAYRTHLIRVLTNRALLELEEMTHGN